MNRHGWLALITWVAAPAAARDSAPAQAWTTAWASAQQTPDVRNALPADPAAAATLRQVIRVTAGGRQPRIRLSNALGAVPLAVAGVDVALSVAPGSAAVRSGSDRPVLFAGAVAATVPAGADYWSDPVALPGVARVEHWGSCRASTWRDCPGLGIVAFGDSITDGSGRPPTAMAAGSISSRTGCARGGRAVRRSSTSGSAAIGCCSTATGRARCHGSIAPCSRRMGEGIPLALFDRTARAITTR
jgi:hypothetical protein